MKRIEEEDEVLCQIGETEDEGEISWVNATTRVDIQSIAAELAGQVQQIEGPICLPGISSDDAKTRVRDISRALKQGHYFDSPIRNASAMGEAAAATLIEVMAAICHVLISVRAENDMVDEVGGTVPSSGRATLQSWSGTAYSVCMTCTSLSWLDCPPTIEVAAQSFLRRSVAYSVDSSYKVGIMSLELLNYILNGLQPRKSAQWMLSLFVATMAEYLNEAVHELFRGALLDDLFVYASVVTDDSYRYYAKRIEEFLRRTCGSE